MNVIGVRILAHVHLAAKALPIITSPTITATMPESRTISSGFGISFSIAITAATNTITAGFIIPSASRTSVGPEQQATHEIPERMPTRQAGHAPLRGKGTPQASGPRQSRRPNLVHGMNWMQPAIKTVVAMMNGMDRLNGVHRIAAIANAIPAR